MSQKTLLDAITRRNALKLLLASFASAPAKTPASNKKPKKVVIIGGGFAGATFARSLRILDKSIEITLIEPNKIYHTCILGAEYLIGRRSANSLTFSYKTLTSNYQINVVHDYATLIDHESKRVFTKEAGAFSYDRCIVASGIGFHYEAIDGYSKEVAERIPHAWQGGHQHSLLKNQISNMTDGGVIIITAPPDDYKCPPGPYERASLIAEYLKINKPRSRIIILDSKDSFPKQQQFESAWEKLYGYGTSHSYINWIGRKQGGTILAVDERHLEITTDFGKIKGNVINIVPPQHADTFSYKNGLAQQYNWCPVNTKTFESLLIPEIHIIGDSAYAEMLPKSAFAAACQARVCAIAIYSLFKEQEPPDPEFMNVCYSLCAENYGISVLISYLRDKNTNILEINNLKNTPITSTDEHHLKESEAAYSMFNTITSEAFG
ncbi:FAD-dependent oxidoreductase [Pseudomonas sp. PD9R]|uniref:FAD-dependent oxidoreductase n=1 Tax=Pseudomonas sp. PD9R TaxID=2853534 RepID=UPI001C488EF6|nr:FAD-dependent oxidoreductase [Pseudomonas sp. PD9R]MBV6824220.1 NAD(P)/FAD-dependent oxidoreductase [Pseudomonas sp. PD9R]